MALDLGGACVHGFLMRWLGGVHVGGTRKFGGLKGVPIVAGDLEWQRGTYCVFNGALRDGNGIWADPCISIKTIMVCIYCNWFGADRGALS